ncbi:MAG: GNAT family N-acetyltransferase [Chitinophagales bacterium]
MTNFENDKKLDNPVWHSLNETHKNFALTFNNLKCYRVEFCPFGGFENGNSISGSMDAYAKLIDNFFIVGDKPDFPKKLLLIKELVCLQMIVERKIDVEIREEIIKLGDAYHKELFDLVNLVQPGYFRSKTMLLGDYYGIFKNGMLVSVAGERMKINDLTEVSAVVTHPDHTGKGYAKQLIGYAVNKILVNNNLPFLHVTETNTGAIKLYDKLGFVTRRKISFWNFETANK